VHADGIPSWVAREDASREILVGLYVRDALGVADPSGLPRLLGTGLPDVGPADERTNWWWQRWWIAILDPDEGRFAGLPAEFADAGDRALAQHLDDARTWADVAHAAYVEGAPHDLVLTEVVRAWEAANGRAAHPFRLRIEVLPLTTAGIWWIGENAIAVDELLRADASSYALAVEPIVARLAAGPGDIAEPVGD
jgi:hypothetical protein